MTTDGQATARIAEHRRAIDETDDALLALLRRRAEHARAIGELKRGSALSMHVPERERQVIERLAAMASPEFPRDAIVSVFREIMSACLRLEEPVRVSCLGPGTTFSHIAMQRIFGVGAQAISEPTLDLVVEAAERERAHYAVVPVENSTEGSVNAALARLVSTPLRIAAQCYLRVEQNLAASPSTPDASSIREVHSHPQALGQARRWLAEHLPHATLVETGSTAAACAHAALTPGVAALCSVPAALEHGLTLLARNVHDVAGNETRFVVLSRSPMFTPRETDSTTLVFGVNDASGSLAGALQAFARNQVNLTSLRSIPDRARPWSVSFWVDAAVPEGDPRFVKALEELGGHITSMRVLGSYPTVGGQSERG